MIAIIDYGVGNLFSLASSLKSLGLETKVTRDAAAIRAADHIILPGVGAFPDAWSELQQRGLPAVLRRQAEHKPILGICLGMQLLMTSSTEVRPCRGLHLVPGTVDKIKTNLKLPHIGWNTLHFKTPTPLFAGVDEGAYVYFVHSYCAVPKEENLVAWTEYGGQIPALVWDGAYCYGAQFHPEKSGEPGLMILRNFADLCQDVSQRKTSKEGFSHDTASRH